MEKERDPGNSIRSDRDEKEIAVRSLIFWDLPIYREKDTNHVS